MLSIILMLFWAAGLVLAFPFAQTNQARQVDHSFSIEVTDRLQIKRNFMSDWAAARNKWGNKIPELSSAGFRLADSAGRVEVEPLGSDEIYIADVQVGNPPQTLKLALDTGSSDLWVQSTDTIYRTNMEGPWAPQYMPNKSHTSRVMEDAEWNVQYVDGTGADGIVYVDTVRLGGFTLPNATIQSAQVIASRFEREHGLTGVLGLAKALPNNINPPTPTTLDLLREYLDHPVFTVDVRRNATGRFDFGKLHTSLASDNITWIVSNPDSVHWDVDFDLTTWDQDHLWYYHKFTATIDTGTTLMFMPDILASRYWLSIDGIKVDPHLSNAYTFLCDSHLPDFSFKLPQTEHILTIPGQYLNYGPVDEDPDYCWGGMQSAAGMETAILGDVMLKALFVAFDLDQGRIGFANKDLSL